ncbi:uncharacterized protein LOC131650559 [Vicia villosa]|uniref:uncharacterized protein LOC131650559 n=1 Tax=Vicia villosa TaxID=3911 RepID=UPI00273B4FBE|nr:uncharacterized protein LOC131650559 [Vicia villosa]
MQGGNSLFVKVFKGKYFPRGDAANAKLGFSPSYAWRSILSAQELVSKGSRWRIGDGSQVKVWSDNWIARNPGFKPLSRPTSFDEDTRVSNFIDHDLWCWNSHALARVFSPADIHNISSIPLSRRSPEDALIWHFSADGVYSVKSAYHVLNRERVANILGPSVSSSIWRKIWKVPLPSKIRYFLWRLAKDILPTRSNLQRKGILLENLCPFCSSCSEDVGHLFLHCDFAKRVYFSPPLGFRLPSEVNILDWLNVILSGKDLFILQLQCVALWKVWHARNLRVFDNKIHDPARVAVEAGLLVEDYNAANFPRRSAPVNHINRLHYASADLKLVKVDAGCFENGSISMGCVVLNRDDSVVMSACKRLEVSVSPCMAEAMAVKWALSLVQSLHFDNFVIQSDALQVVNCISGLSVIADIVPIVADCKSLLASFKNVVICFNSRDYNSEAHHMVGIGRLHGSKTWFDCIPQFASIPSCNLPAILPFL